MLRPFSKKINYFSPLRAIFFFEIELMKAQEAAMSENLIKNHSRSASSF